MNTINKIRSVGMTADNQEEPGWTSGTNRNYKDALFKLIFNNKRNLLELYNTLNDSSYTNEDELEINTLGNVIYMNIKNDISFLLHCYLNLYEQQSTVNPNMPLRMLFYVSDLYSEMLGNGKNDLYREKMLKIPAPVFLVFYNGYEEQEDRVVYRLSDLYKKLPVDQDSTLNLNVVVLNINRGHNKELLEKCRMLYEYSYYVAAVREYAKDYDIKAAVKLAIDECLAKEILKDVLTSQRAEVEKVSIYEYDEELHLQTLKEDSMEEGRKEGRKEGRIEALVSAVKNNMMTLDNAVTLSGADSDELRKLLNS